MDRAGCSSTENNQPKRGDNKDAPKATDRQKSAAP